MVMRSIPRRMKRFLCIALCCLGSPLAAQEALSPIQQYLAYESGYVPGVEAQPAAPVEPEPYDTAYVPIYPADEAMEPYAYETQHLNQGVSGMNF